MKNYIIVAITLLAIGVGSCKKAKELADIGVNIPYNQQVTLPRVDGYVPGADIPGGAVVSLPPIGVATQSKVYLDQYHTNSNKVRSVTVKTLNVTLLQPTDGNFNWLDKIYLYISAPGLPEILIASTTQVPLRSRTITLDPATENLKSYFLADTMYLRETIHINQTPPLDATMQINTVFHLVANPLY